MCVTLAVRACAAQENATAADRSEPNGGANGPNTCKQGSAVTIRTISAQPDAAHVCEQLDTIAGMLGRQLLKVETMPRDAADDVRMRRFPWAASEKISLTNPP